MSIKYYTIFLTKNKESNMKLLTKLNQHNTQIKNKNNRPWRNNGQFNNHRFKEKLD